MTITSGIIKRCLEECERSTYKFRIGAVIFSSKRIISSGHNEIRSSNIPSKHKLYNNSVHAEQAALLGTDWNKLKGCSILVMKCSKTLKQLSNAKPCPMCMKILEHVGIKDIYYSNEQGEIVKYNFYTPTPSEIFLAKNGLYPIRKYNENSRNS